jgi:hypothetical protein
MQYYAASRIQIDPESKLVCRYLDSQAPLMVSVTGLDARETLNLILLYRCIISYKPSNVDGSLSDFPLTLAYGKKIDALRRRYREYLWDAEFRDNLGATVDAEGAHRYTVFQTAAGKRAVIVVNLENGNAIRATLHIPNPGSLVAATPERPDAQPTSGALNIPPRSAVVVMEQ